jgi:hypothetical protein
MMWMAAGMMVAASVLVVRKWLVVPESNMAQFLMVVASVLIILRRAVTVNA